MTRPGDCASTLGVVLKHTLFTLNLRKHQIQGLSPCHHSICGTRHSQGLWNFRSFRIVHHHDVQCLTLLKPASAAQGYSLPTGPATDVAHTVRFLSPQHLIFSSTLPDMHVRAEAKVSTSFGCIGDPFSAVIASCRANGEIPSAQIKDSTQFIKNK